MGGEGKKLVGNHEKQFNSLGLKKPYEMKVDKD